MVNQIINMDVMQKPWPISDGSVNCCVTSPPYWGLRDYGTDRQIGLENSPEEYVEKMVEVFREVRRVLRKDGVVWLNLGDSYYNYRPGGVSQIKQTIAKNDGAVVLESSKRNRIINGLKEKDLVGIPWRVAFALQADGWWLRQDIIWSKPNPIPESVKDRCTRSHEYIFLLTKSKRYWYDSEAIKEPFVTEPGKLRDKRNENYGSSCLSSFGAGLRTGYGKNGRNKHSVWRVATQPFRGAHFATFPPKLIEPCILAGCPVNGVVLDPFGGSGTTGMVAKILNRNYILLELNPKYVEIARERIESAIQKNHLI